MFFTLDVPLQDISWREEEISRLLPNESAPDEQVGVACDHFGRILSDVFRAVGGRHTWRYWCVDELSCDTLTFKGSVASLAGEACWLQGGELCERFQLDVAFDSKPLLYSYKFYTEDLATQSLYVAKTHDCWHLST